MPPRCKTLVAVLRIPRIRRSEHHGSSSLLGRLMALAISHCSAGRGSARPAEKALITLPLGSRLFLAALGTQNWAQLARRKPILAPFQGAHRGRCVVRKIFSTGAESVISTTCAGSNPHTGQALSAAGTGKTSGDSQNMNQKWRDVITHGDAMAKTSGFWCLRTHARSLCVARCADWECPHKETSDAMTSARRRSNTRSSSSVGRAARMIRSQRERYRGSRRAARCGVRRRGAACTSGA